MDPVYASLIAFLGLSFGSFLNVCIYRLPLGKSVVQPNSRMPGLCKAYRVLRQHSDSQLVDFARPLPQLRHTYLPRYIAIEALTGALFVGCYAYAGLSLATLKYCAFGFLILGLIFTDAETKLLPDKLTLPGLALGLIFSLLVPVNDLASQFLPGMIHLPFSVGLESRLLSLLDALLGAALGASFIYGAGAMYLRWRGTEGMGFGDVKLMAMVGAFLGMKLTILTIFTASLAGSFFGLGTVLLVWVKRTHRFMRRLTTLRAARRRGWQSARMMYRHYQMPFGVFLGSMALLSLFVGNEFLRWYGRLWW